ncbi:Aldolase [Hortaea werneckii]|nr:Aldolase [Hortaea werneckii]KAI7671622.1 Aldolase [Hortaea werneckii]
MSGPPPNDSTRIPHRGPTSKSEDGALETTFLIIGAGPAGAALACFLAQHGYTGIMLSSAPGTAKEPRAHITNPAALECLRDIGLEADVNKAGTTGDHMQHTRWCHDMAGDEYARIYSWGNQPEKRGEYDAASPCRHTDVPQTLLEPILVKHATTKGWKARFDSTFERFERDTPNDPITSHITDNLTGLSYTIRSKYLFGCDGARSAIMRQLEIPLKKEPGQGLALNVLVEADLRQHMEHRTGNLHWIMQPDAIHPPWGWATILRMVKAWHEWMFIVFPEPGFSDYSVRPSNEEYIKRVREWIGDDTIPVKILDAAKWYINEIVAEKYSDGNIFCLGDAVHRHPPLNGLGSNTCVQDAFNLAWKLAYIEKGHAQPKLLESYSLERQPIGAGVIQRANQGLRDHVHVWEALGVLPDDVEERKRQHAELSAPTPAGRERRKKLQDAVKYTEHEFGGIGIEMNQRYDSGAVYFGDEATAQQAPPSDPVLQYQLSTYPGSRLPHAWLNKRSPAKAPISTIDLAGHGAFCLLTGIGGDAWKQAAEKSRLKLSVPINAYSVGWKQDWEDVYGDWARRREIEEDGSSTWSYHSLPRRPIFLTDSSLAARPRPFQQQYPRSMATADGAAALKQSDVKQEAQHLANGSVPVNNNWSSPGQAAYDFRSDVVTTPTTRMLNAIASTTLLDDVFQDDPTTNDLEAFIADLTGKEAALLVLSGTMGNQVSIRTHLGAPPHSVVTDHRSHILEWEAGGVASLCGALVKPVTPSNGRYVTLEDVQKQTVLSDDIHACPTKLISLENTLAGIVLPLDECQRISRWARENGVLMHLDGARLWEAVAAGAGSLKEYCDCFDSVSLCFSKGLGAPIGSIIAGTKPFRERARWIRKSIGGGLRQAGVVTAAARVAVEDTFLGGTLQASHERARQIAKMWEGYGGKTTNPVETNMVWFDLDAAGISTNDFIKEGEKVGLRLLGGRLVVHYQIGEDAVARLERLMQAVLKGGKTNGTAEHPPEKLQFPTE